ncbi:hypothetical protein CAPTEDRAFT_113807, partial [Capitella teleta]
NCRPISITRETCKVLEKIIKSTLTEYLELNNLIHNAQHGFRSGRSPPNSSLSLTSGRQPSTTDRTSTSLA